MGFVEDLNNIIISEETSLKTALKFLDKNGVQILLVTDNNGVLVGLITDGDVRRHILHNGNLNVKAIEIANLDYFYLNKADIKLAADLLNKKSINHIPIVDENRCLISLAVQNDSNYANSSNFEIPVVIMAGGKGTRLLPLTRIIPKPLIPVGVETMLEKIINNLCNSGFNNFKVIVNYKKELIKSYMNDNNYSYELEFFEESEYYGTVGGLTMLKGKIETNFILTNCDIISYLNYSALMEWHNNHGADLTVLGVRKRIDVPYGVLEVNDHSFITKINEKPHFHNLIVGGLYVLSPSILDQIPEGEPFGMDQLIKKLIGQGKKVTCYPLDHGWHDIGQFDEYRELLRTIGDIDA